jgi:hypothetical protein
MSLGGIIIIIMIAGRIGEGINNSFWDKRKDA